jgi:hypothetical protein
MKKLLALMCLFLVSNADASIFAKIGSGAFDKNKKTHIIMVGSADEAGKLFQQAAITKGLKYQEVNPQNQVIFLMEFEGKLKDNVGWLQGKKVQVVKSNKSMLLTAVFVDVARSLRSISTIDIYSHSGVSYGAKLSDFGRFNTADKSILKIKPNLAPDAYMVLHGCNSGFDEAPLFSELLEIPVFGSMTSTDFQEKLSDGKWYFNNSEDKPAGLKLDPKCTNGLCIRMKPRNGAYTGYWGNYSGGGLPFYKAYCTKISEEKCLSALAKTTLNAVGSKTLSKTSTEAEYKEVVQDLLCPISPTKNLREECIAKLDAALAAKEESNGPTKSYSPFNGKQLQCSFEGCKFKFVCTNPRFSSGICDLVNTATDKATTFVDEYLSYMTAFKYLKK